MQEIKKFVIRNLPFLIILMLLVMPVFSLAQVVDTDQPDRDPTTGEVFLVPCGHTNSAEVIENPCSFKDALTLVNAIIEFILRKLVVPIAAIMFFYAGFKMVTSGGSAEARGTAKKVFTNTVIGLVIAAGAWLIVKTILSILSSPGTWVWIGF